MQVSESSENPIGRANSWRRSEAIEDFLRTKPDCKAMVVGQLIRTIRRALQGPSGLCSHASFEDIQRRQ